MGACGTAVGLEPDGVLLGGVEVGGQDQLGLERETVPGRDLQALARAESQPLELVRRVGVDRPDELAVGRVEPLPRRRLHVGPARQEEPSVRAHGHGVAAARLRQPLDRTAGLGAIEIRRHRVVARAAEVDPAVLASTCSTPRTSQGPAVSRAFWLPAASY